MSDLHLEIAGDGHTALFVHGSYGWGADTFPHQRALADSCRIVLVDRRGFGRSPKSAVGGWPQDAVDLDELLAELGPAHVVGQSYGAVSSLVAVLRHPERVRSLVVIEPPAFHLARGDESADRLARALEPVYERASELSTEEFARAWGAALGRTPDQNEARLEAFTDDDWAAAEGSRRERWPGDAPIDLDALSAVSFPVVVVAGGWRPDIAPGAQQAGAAFRAVCDALHRRGGARLEVFEGSTHNPQIEEPERFNTLLRDVWQTSPAKRGG